MSCLGLALLLLVPDIAQREVTLVLVLNLDQPSRLIRNDWMRRDMQRYTQRQTYCRKLEDVRPPARPLVED